MKHTQRRMITRSETHFAVTFASPNNRQKEEAARGDVFSGGFEEATLVLHIKPVLPFIQAALRSFMSF